MSDEYPPEEDIIDHAITTHCNDDVEIDGNPEVSYGDTGAWVQAWVYVPYNDVEGS
jgi:hypothetical protein